MPATVSLDLERFDRVLEVDRTSRAARIQAGVLGPDLEAKLRPHGLTLRHFPQSFEFSTLGGWIATRAGGHYATQYTHIDDFVESTRMVTPAGVVETRRLPALGRRPGARPAGHRLRRHDGRHHRGLDAAAGAGRRFRASASVRFRRREVAAAACVRALSQSGLQPSNCRLLDAAEVAFAGVGDRSSPTLVLGFESADHPLQAWMARALELVADHGGRVGRRRRWRARCGRRASSRRGAPQRCRRRLARRLHPHALLARRDHPPRRHLRHLRERGHLGSVRGLLRRRAARRRDAIDAHTGHASTLSCRFTHVYPDGPAPYFTFAARGSSSGDVASALARWRDIKLACNEAVVRHGGTSTHHHAVGRDHRNAYETEVPLLMRQAFAGAKAVLDPRGVMNPGVLFDPVGRAVGLRGVLEPVKQAPQ